MFKNLLLYRIAPDWAPDFNDLSRRLESARFAPCSGAQDKAVGWVEPRGHTDGPLLESVGGQWVALLRVETRSVPASVVRRMAQERAQHIEATTGRKPGKRELRDLADDIRLQLLPMAFPKQSSVWVWIDLQQHLLVLDAASAARGEDAITLLVQQWPGFAVSLVHTQTAPGTAMADWLLGQEPPAGFSIDRECELKAADESKAVVRYARHRLDIEEVQQHIREGKLPTRLALTWADRVSFVLTEGLQLKKLAFLDGVFESASTDKADDFDTDVALTTGELSRLLPDLLDALGGEQLPGLTAATPAPAKTATDATAAGAPGNTTTPDGEDF